MAAKLYVDHMSQPSRSCIIFCRVNQLPVEEQLINIAKGGTKSAEYQSINPLGKVPFYKDGPFGLAESAAILKYLAEKHRNTIPDHWYPINLESRARVDAIMAWHGSTLRAGSMVVVWNLALSKMLGSQPNAAVVKGFGYPTLQRALQVLDSVWLKEGAFVAGNQISIADLLLACEVEQLCLLDSVAAKPNFQDLLQQYPAVRPWLDRVAIQCGPHYDNAHSLLRKVKSNLARANSKL